MNFLFCLRKNKGTTGKNVIRNSIENACDDVVIINGCYGLIIGLLMLILFCW